MSSASDTSSGKSVSAKVCGRCQKTYPGDVMTCPDDGVVLTVVGDDPLIGTIFAEKYEIQSVLGRGGMSVVYKARHKYMNRVVAVKLMLEQHMDDPVAFKRFQQESEAASSLSHQNIVIVHDFGVSKSGQAYFVMDCLEGESLEDLVMREGPVPADRAINIFRQICDGLQHAHKKSVVHRDIKPSNIVLIKEDDGSETVKIVDFGLAKLHRAQGPDEMRLTQSGVVFGSPLYMSPEQCQGNPLDPRSDIYSLGCLMYETLAGVTAFSAESFFNLALMHLHQAPPPISERAPGVVIFTELEAVITKCLEKDPANRFQNVEQLRQKLLDAALISGVPGLKPGAVLVSESGKQSALRMTWENMKAALDPAVVAQDSKRISVPRVAFVAITVSLLIAGTVFMCMWPGVEGDRGTNFDKLRWQLALAFGQQATQSGDFAKADHYLKEAKKLAMGFGDRQSRLRMTLEQQADMFRKFDRFADAEKASVEAGDILTRQVLMEAETVKNEIRDLGLPVDSETKKATNQLSAIAIANRVSLSAKRLYSRALYPQEETLLKQAIGTFDKLGLRQSDQVADFDVAMADVLTAEQRLSEVRPFLKDALSIRESARSDGSTQSIRALIRTQLKIGQFDRDQSNFSDSEIQLSKALKSTEKNFPNDKPLMAECLNSYADLERQTGKPEQAAVLLQRARSLNAGASAASNKAEEATGTW